MIHKLGGKYVLFTADGTHILGRHSTLAEAKRHEAHILQRQEAEKSDGSDPDEESSADGQYEEGEAADETDQTNDGIADD